MANITEEKKWTYADYLKLEDEKRYEIIGGHTGTCMRKRTCTKSQRSKSIG